MSVYTLPEGPTPAQLLEVIRTQTEIAKLGIDHSRVMTLVAEQACRMTGAIGGVVELVDGDEMVYRTAVGSLSGQAGLRLKRRTSLSGLCVATRSALSCEDSDLDPRVDREACRKVGARSMIVVPLVHHQECVGVLKVIAGEIAAFDDSDLEILSLMSELIAAAMFHSARYGSDELFHRATTDGLTGLANRTLFFDRLQHAIAGARREGCLAAVLMVDMDRLKQVNDQFGQLAGDAAIREIARRLASELRDCDTAARIGGDEFAIVLSRVGSEDDVLAVSDRLAQHCSRPLEFDGQSLELGASVGSAVYPHDGQDAETLIACADQAMYTAKRARKLAMAAQ